MATNDIGVVMTSSPGPTPSAVSDRNSALVQLESDDHVVHAEVLRKRPLERGGARPGRQEHAAQHVGRRGDVGLGQGMAIELDTAHQNILPL